MKKSIRFITLGIALCMLLGTLFGSIVSTAASYTYSIDGTALASPDAFTPDGAAITSSDLGLTTPLNTPKDLFVDYNNKVYIADPKNNRIVVTDKYLKKVVLILTSFTNSNGVADALSAPEGVFVTSKSGSKDGEIFVADTGNARLVVFDYEGNYLRHFDRPVSDVFDSDASYAPVAVAVNKSGTIYVVSRDTYEGVIALNADGAFSCIVASTKADSSVLDALWSRFQTAAQKAQNEQNLSYPFNNIDIDENDMIYVTTDAIDESSQQSAVTGKSTSSDYAPVKKLNPNGDDIMRRNGFYPPSGEVSVSNKLTTTNQGAPTGASKIVDVAIGQEGTWSIADQKRSHIFTYDKNGNLLVVFGDKGSQLGNTKTISAIAYQFVTEDASGIPCRLLALDQENNSITIYKRTEYGDILMTALEHTNNKEYDKAEDDWKEILKRNNNYDAAYVGIGDTLYREGKWEEAMDMYKTAYDKSSYSDSFKMYRKDLISKILIWIVVIAVVLLIALSKFLGFVEKVNDRATHKKGKRNVGEEILYAFHVIVHPFDGFWDLKHEKRGSVRGAIFWLVMVTIAFVYQSFGTSYIVSGSTNATAGSALTQAIGIVVPLMLFVTANWCLTTLMEGEGTFKDIFIATCYAASPLSYLIIIATVISNFVTESETGFVSLITGFAWVWFFIMLFFGVMVTHDYTMSKNILTILGTIVGMCIIMFLVILFSGLLMKMTSFVGNIFTELSFRM